MYLTGDIFRRTLMSAEINFGGDKFRQFFNKFLHLSLPKYISSKVSRKYKLVQPLAASMGNAFYKMARGQSPWKSLKNKGLQE